uniref:Ig-like domain-containing protein n=1 Tax=Mastacembelus armatus TaxID=205130 RepID=A0A7N8X0I9_9TELE
MGPYRRDPVSQHASGVEVYEGAESVLLPCQASVSVSEGSKVTWSREDLRDSSIHARLLSGDDLTRQNQRYRNRTLMKTDALITGDLSLTLRKPNIFDSGNYTCTVRRSGVDLSSTEVQLKIKTLTPHTGQSCRSEVRAVGTGQRSQL